MRVRVNIVLEVDEDAFNGDIQEYLEETMADLLYDLDDTEVSKITVALPR